MDKRKILKLTTIGTLLCVGGGMLLSRQIQNATPYNTGLLSYLSKTTQRFAYDEKTDRLRIVLDEEESARTSTLEWFKGISQKLDDSDFNGVEVSIPVSTSDTTYAIEKYVLTLDEIKTLDYSDEESFYNTLKSYKVN